jgi:hypothetical protein
VALCGAFSLGGVGSASAQSPEGLYTIRQRFGVNVATAFQGVPGFPGRLSDFPGADQLGFGWYSDWAVNPAPERPNDMEYAQLLQTRRWPPNWEYLRQTAQANPGALWIIGNEPETRGQGQHTPQEYATRYFQAYQFLKDVDPSASIAIGGVVMPTPLRLQWLDMTLDAYQRLYGHEMPVDVWNIHVQILQEKRGDWGCGIPYGSDADQGRMYEIIDNASVAAFEQLIIEFRQWMHARGQRDKPLIISEYGVLMPSSYLPTGDQAVLDFMAGTFDFMLTARDPDLGYAADGDRLVQRWMWFSLNFPLYDDTPGGFNGSLYDWREPHQLTVYGEFLRDYVRSVRVGEVWLPLIQDTYLDPALPTEALGARGRIKLRADVGSYATAGLLFFGLHAVPAGAQITEATLTLQPVARSNAQPLRVTLAPATCAWIEAVSLSDWRLCTPWQGQASVMTLQNDAAPATADITALVQRWVNGTLPNHGLLLDPSSAGNRGNVTYDIASREWAEGAQSEPTLLVRYIAH